MCDLQRARRAGLAARRVASPPMPTPTQIRLPGPKVGPVARLGRRVVIALALIVFVALVAYADRGGYRDAAGDAVGLLDCFYYATVSITTTGYGDITPVSDSARLLNALLITPARILFLILLVGTTLEVLAEGSRAAIRERRWRKKLRGHIIVCGYGTKGRNAIQTLRSKGAPADEILVIDDRPDTVAEATEHGYAAMVGDATRMEVLLRAGVDEAATVIVAADADADSVLITLTAREHNKRATIVAAAREEENRHLLHESGADSVITSSAAAGRLLGQAATSPRV